MALVFKIKFNDILRRWLVSEDFNSMTFSLTLSQLEDKIRELFHLSPTSSLVITYVDKENDVVTLGDDQDLVDACLVQQLNPLRLDVHEKESATQEAAAMSSPSSSEVCNLDMLKGFLPQATADNIRNIVKASSQVLDPKHLPGFLGGNSKKGLLAGGLPNAGLGSVIVPNIAPHVPVLPNLRAHGAYHVFHSGVQCDGCGMNPIEGPRYISIKVPNYDLCFGCYDMMGTEADFEKLEHPLNPHGHSFFFDRGARPPAGPTWGSLFTQGANAWMPECPFSGQAMDFAPLSDHHKKLDARFVKDVTVFDGTELRPGTKFTKIWRMANNGTLPWPQGTQLVHIAGDALSLMEVVNVELPEGGLPCGEEVEISVNLTAPDVVGRYVSHWRLLSPSGRKFGHRVWVAIQVIFEVNASIKEEESFVNVEVNHGQDSTEAIVEKGKFPVASKLNFEEGSSSNATDMHDNGDGVPNNQGNQLVSEKGSSSNATDMHENGDGVPNNQGNQPLLDTEIDIELDGFSVVEKPVEVTQFERLSTPTEKEMTETNMDTVLKLLGSLGSDDRELKLPSPTEKEITETNMETRLKLLESLGFDDRELNLFWLKKNNGSVEGTLEDVLACAGWEEVIRNLKEMGFDDQPTNLRLLRKHKGSIKLVVKDLVKMEKGKEG